MSDYPHKLLIFRAPAAAGGSQDADGVWTDNPALDDVEEVYNDRADVQDAGKVLEQDNMGEPDVKSDAVAFLRNERAITSIKPGDSAQVTWEDGAIDIAVVNKTRRLDGTVFLRRV